MGSDGWSSEPVYVELTKKEYNKALAEIKPWPEAWIEEAVSISPASWDKLKNLKTQGSNLIDENQNLYFQCCECEALFDPHTKSFKSLHDLAAKADWKFRWNKNGDGYLVYCVKCGEGIE